MSVINFTGSSGPLVKVCGLQSTEAAECALDSTEDDIEGALFGLGWS